MCNASKVIDRRTEHLVETAAGDGVGVLFHRQQQVQRHSQIANMVERTDVDTANTQTNIADFIQLQCWSQPDELCFVGVQL